MNKKLKELKRRENCASSYEVVEPLIGLNKMSTENEKVRALVFAANDILTEICRNADMIKVDLFDDVSCETNIEKRQWLEFVDLARSVSTGTVSEKRLQKINEGFEHNIFIINIRRSFIDTYINNHNGGKVELPVKNQDIDIPELKEKESSPEFETLLEQAVNIRTYLNSVLWPAFKQMSEAAEHVTDFKLNYFDFKNLVDWEHYKRGGYPSENSKPKLWSIINRFVYATKLMQKYEFVQINTLLRQFGLELNITEPHPSLNNFSDIARLFANYEVLKPKNTECRDKIRTLLDLAILEDEHIIIINDMWCIYDNECRVIRLITTMLDDTIIRELCKPAKNDKFELLKFDNETILEFMENNAPELFDSTHAEFYTRVLTNEEKQYIS